MNKHYSKLILILVLIIIAAAFWFIREEYRLDSSDNPKPDLVIKFDPATIKTETVTDDGNPALEIKTEYPVSTIGADYIKGRIDAALLKFKADNDPAKFSAQDLEEFGPNKDRQYTFITEYKAYGNSNFLSHRIDTYVYSGGAHGGTTAETFTYNTKGKEILPEDLFVDQAAVTKFSEIVQTAALALPEYKEMINTEWLAESAGPDVSNFNTFAFSGDKIIVIFQQYAIAPYAAGIIEVSIPLGELGGILKPEFLK